MNLASIKSWGIFNRVNSQGTPLTRADLALAHVCSIWPEARAELRAFSLKMGGLGFPVDLSFLVRCIAGVATGSIVLEGTFMRTPSAELKSAWREIQPAFEHLVGVLRHEAYIGGLSDLPTDNVLVPVTIFLARHGGTFPSDTIKCQFIRWVYLAGLWGRYSGATATKLQQDVAVVADSDLNPTEELEQAILRERGRVALEERDLLGARVNSAVALLSRVVARARDGRDWFIGSHIYDSAVGKSQGDEHHFIFSKSVLKNAGITDQKLINTVANRAILVKKPSLAHRRSQPADYLREVEENHPGALQEQSVPMEPELWVPERFPDFLKTRRHLLAKAINEFIERWSPEVNSDAMDEHKVCHLIAGGENQNLEFKSTMRWDLNEEKVNKVLEDVVVKTLSGFLNAEGGTLLIGVDDTGGVIGLVGDYGSLKGNDRDAFERHLHQIVSRDLGEAVSASYLTVNFHDLEGKDICQVAVDPSNEPVYVENSNQAVFYLRSGNLTRSLPVDETVKYVQQHWGK